MKDYGQIRRMYADGCSKSYIASVLHVSRNTVKKYCSGDAVPWERKTPERESTVVTDEVLKFIKACFEDDEREGIPKQEHTAKKIYDRLVDEKDFTGGESTIRKSVSKIKNSRPKVFIPLEFSPGEAMQVDWGEAKTYMCGVKITFNIFCARLCSSCTPIVYAYRRQNEESFHEAFVRTFNFFGGVPHKVIFDNGKVAVKSGFGVHAEKQAGYTALSSHYAFDAQFCNPAEGHEKGLVEGLVGWARRNILVPIPHVESMDELNALLESRCIKYREHFIQGKPDSVGNMFLKEQEALMSLPGHPFETAKSVNTRVSSSLTIRFDTNNYSVPYEYAGSNVGVKGYPEYVEIYCKGKLISKHERCMKKHQSVYKLEHYLPILERRPRALFNAKPVRQNLPEKFLDWLQAQNFNHNQLMQVMYDCVEYGYENVWHGLNVQKPKPQIGASIEDNIVVRAVDLSIYDALSSWKGGVS